MPQTFDDIDRLMGRLRQVARELPEPGSEAASSVAPPVFAHRRLLDELKSIDQQASASQGGAETERLELAALMQLDRGVDDFLVGAYRRLLGRDPDQSGLATYRRAVARRGRLHVLAMLLQSEESRCYRHGIGCRVENENALTGPLAWVERTGPARRLCRLPVIAFHRLWEKWKRSQWHLTSRHLRSESSLHTLQRRMISVLHDVDGQLERLDHFLATQQEREQETEALRHRQASLWSALQQQRRDLERRLNEGDVPRPLPVSPDVQQDSLDRYYLAFEDAYRGTEEKIRTHLRRYLVQVDQARGIGRRSLDLGCGRGEWLALLREEGMEPRGVDLNRAMVDHCRSQGFDVSLQDALTALRELPDESMALVSGFHIAEHLPFETLFSLVDEAHRVLQPGGVLILETPNPENLLVGSHSFYHDPTHRNPLTPISFSFLLDYHGFHPVEVRRFNPHPEQARLPGDDDLTARLNEHFCAAQDFAVVGCKVPSDGAGMEETSA